jgi:hypothetical protein
MIKTTRKIVTNHCVDRAGAWRVQGEQTRARHAMPQQLEERQNLFYLGAGLSPLRRLDGGIQAVADSGFFP